MIYYRCEKPKMFRKGIVLVAMLFSFGEENMKGRKVIYTDYKEIDDSNILEVLTNAYGKHIGNAAEISFLLNYESGEVNPIREKVYRKEIHNFIPDSLANYITEFKLGFEWGNPFTFVQSDDDDVEDNDMLTKAISLTNQNYRKQKIGKKQQELGRFVEICGVGYTYVDVNTSNRSTDSPFTVDVLHPGFTFVVRSTAYTDKRIVLGVSFRTENIKGKKRKIFDCFTDTTRYTVVGLKEITYKEMNPLGKIPIVEWIRSYDRQGCFERLIPLIDSLTASISSFLDGVQGNTDTIWWGSDIEFPVNEIENEDGTITEEVIKPKDGDWLITQSNRDGKAPSVKPLTVDYDYKGQLENIVATRSHILSLAHVPQRNDNSGGSTGVAMDDAAGWTDAEADACRKQLLLDGSKMEELELVTYVYQVNPKVDAESPLSKLEYSDCAVSFKRSKQYEMTVKVNAISTLLGHGFALEDTLNGVAMFEDPNQVVARSGEGVKRYQDANVFKDSNTSEPKLMADLSDQQTNSPLIGGMSKQEAIEVEE